MTDNRFHLPNTRPEQALYWFDFGLRVIPVIPGEKRTVIKWDPWLEGLDRDKIQRHWTEHPDHDVGFIVDEGLLVLDTDRPESEQALSRIEREYGAAPLMIVKTAHGQHHFFRVEPGAAAKTDSHASALHPDRIDVKANRSLVVLPPSGGREIFRKHADTRDRLYEVDQAFVDAVFQHNGRRPPGTLPDRAKPEPDRDGASLPVLEGLLKHIDPDGGYADWTGVGMALFHETQGSDDGLALFDRWSSGGTKYRGTHEIEAKWRSFSLNVANPVTLGTLIMRAKAAGADVEAILQGDGDFQPCVTEVIEPQVAVPEKGDCHHPLGRYSLRGEAEDIRKQMVDAIPVLGKLAFLGQITALYAAPNTGKTLIVLHLLIEAIQCGQIDPDKVYYVNADDNGQGLVAKLDLADEYGFHMLAEGFKGFEMVNLIATIDKLAETGQAKGVVVIVDTLKKAVEIMDKRKSAYDMRSFRRFSLKGGTAILLAHTNKKAGQDGKPVYAGTTDVIEDVDAAHVISVVPTEGAENKVVEFENRKGRGFVAQRAAYSYSVAAGLSYAELLMSVREVSPADLVPMKEAAEQASEATVLAAIENRLDEGINTKMKLATTAGKQAGCSRRQAVAVIEKYTGDDPRLHRWRYIVGARGAFVYELLERPGDRDAQPDA